jgi:hypothetical protein
VIPIPHRGKDGFSHRSRPVPLSHVAGDTRHPSKKRIIWDDFSDGFRANCPNSKWVYSLGPYVTNDGIVTVNNETLEVIASGKNPLTNEPTFRNTIAPNSQNAYGIPGDNDHAKFLVTANHFSAKGVPGFTVLPGQRLSFQMNFSGRTFGTALAPTNPFNPFPPQLVTKPNDDLRLASAAMVTVDFATFTVFDFFLTNESLYALYERLPFGRTTTNNYRSFTAIRRIGPRTPDQFHRLKIAYDRNSNTASWIVDGQTQVSITDIGLISPSFTTIIDRGGTTTQPYRLDQLNVGLGLFTVLDAFDYNNPNGTPSVNCEALVRLNDQPNYYFCPNTNNPASFFSNDSPEKDRLFGQGAQMKVQCVVVTTSPTATKPCPPCGN